VFRFAPFAVIEDAELLSPVRASMTAVQRPIR
jgi:hypothetical protein